MASETLAVKEDSLGEFIDLLRAGMKHQKVNDKLRASLVDWCAEVEEYLHESFCEELWPQTTWTE